jgi:hypothetical protein
MVHPAFGFGEESDRRTPDEPPAFRMGQLGVNGNLKLIYAQFGTLKDRYRWIRTPEQVIQPGNHLSFGPLGRKEDQR